MKAFYAAIIILIVVVIFISVNYSLINSISKNMNLLIDDAKNIEFVDRLEITKKISDYWQDISAKMRISVVNTEIEKIDEYIAILNASIKDNQETEYNKTLDLIKTCIKKITKLESFEQMY